MTDPNQPDIPNDVTREVSPHSVEDTGISSEEKIDRLLATAVAVREELVARGRRMAKWIIGLGLTMTLALGFAGGVLWGLKDIASQNRVNGTIVRANSEAILAATGPESRARSAIATSDVIRRNVIEGDCRMRRVQARMVAPNPDASCESQTPKEIYPGTEGEPPRG